MKLIAINKQKISAHLPFITLGVLLVVGSVLRILFAVGRDFEFDEIVTYNIASSTIPKILELNKTSNSAPLLYTLFIHVLSKFAGQSELLLRGISLFGGVLAILFAYLAGKEWFSKEVGLVSSALVALAASQIQFSTQLREYSLTVLLVFCALYLFRRVLLSPDNLIAHLVFFITLGFMLWTQYGLVFPAFTIFGFWLLARNQVSWKLEKKDQDINGDLSIRSSYRGILLSILGIILLAINVFLIYILIFRFQFRMGFGDYLVRYYRPVDRPFIIGTIILLKNTKDLFVFSAGSSLGAIPLGAFAILGLVSLRGIADRNSKLVILIGLFVWIETFLAAVFRFYPYGGIRQDIFLTPFIYLLAAQGCVYIFKNRPTSLKLLSSIGVAVIIISSSWYMIKKNSWVPVEQFSEVVTYIQKNRSPGEAIYVNWDGKPGMSFYGNKLDEPVLSGALHTRIELDTLGECIQKGNGTCWVVYSHCEACMLFLTNIPRSYQVNETFQTHNKSVGVFKVGLSQVKTEEISIEDFRKDNPIRHLTASNNVNGTLDVQNGNITLSYQNSAGKRDMFGYNYKFLEPMKNVSGLRIEAKLSPGSRITVDIQVNNSVVDPRIINYRVGNGEWEVIRIPVPDGDLKMIYISISEPPSFNDLPPHPSVEIRSVEAEVIVP